MVGGTVGRRCPPHCAKIVVRPRRSGSSEHSSMPTTAYYARRRAGRGTRTTNERVDNYSLRSMSLRAGARGRAVRRPRLRVKNTRGIGVSAERRARPACTERWRGRTAISWSLMAAFMWGCLVAPPSRKGTAPEPAVGTASAAGGEHPMQGVGGGRGRRR